MFKKVGLSSHPIRSSVAFGDFTVDRGIDRDEIMVDRTRRSVQLGYSENDAPLAIEREPSMIMSLRLFGMLAGSTPRTAGPKPGGWH